MELSKKTQKNLRLFSLPYFANKRNGVSFLFYLSDFSLILIQPNLAEQKIQIKNRRRPERWRSGFKSTISRWCILVP